MTLLLYGAYGYTGELIAREAVDRGMDVIVAGRNGTKTRGVGIQLGVESRVFSAGEAGHNLEGVEAVLNCAGPFVETYEPFVDACLRTGTHYLDITGELSVFEAVAERDREAEKAGVCLLPGVGFDVVPTDCLAGHLHDRLQGATHLRLGFEAPATVSGGTVASAIEHASGGGKVRRDGAIEDEPLAADSRRIDFGNGSRNAVRIPWGDVSTAYYTTGIENIEVYTAMPGSAARAMRFSQPVSGLLSVGPVKRGLQALGRRLAAGPSEAERETGRTYVWGEASDGEGTVTSRLTTPETYALTVDAATTAAGRLAAADADAADLAGYQTPATAFDPEFVLELDGVEGFLDDGSPGE
jgi:short subunit dehydrogenase-like uncharacterized protein